MCMYFYTPTNNAFCFEESGFDPMHFPSSVQSISFAKLKLSMSFGKRIFLTSEQTNKEHSNKSIKFTIAFSNVFSNRPRVIFYKSVLPQTLKTWLPVPSPPQNYWRLWGLLWKLFQVLQLADLGLSPAHTAPSESSSLRRPSSSLPVSEVLWRKPKALFALIPTDSRSCPRAVLEEWRKRPLALTSDWSPTAFFPFRHHLGSPSQVFIFQVFTDNGLGTDSSQVYFNERLCKSLKTVKMEGNNFLLMNMCHAIIKVMCDYH